jgi:hypothetical protein
MNLQKLIAVSSLPGIYRMVQNKSNGLIVENLKDGKRNFLSTRTYQFNPLESIAIYVNNGDTVPLAKVMDSMLANIETTPPAKIQASADELRQYFAVILPEFDRDRVHISDIKKIIKWFEYLHETGVTLLPDPVLPTTEPETATQED